MLQLFKWHLKKRLVSLVLEYIAQSGTWHTYYRPAMPNQVRITGLLQYL